MSYMSIKNLYADQRILAFRECYATEKLHGSSAHIRYHAGALSFFCGGADSNQFNALFDAPALVAKLTELYGLDCQPVTVYGEAYGGKLQGMKLTYGDKLKFAAFEVAHGLGEAERFEMVEHADEVVKSLGLEFVHYRKISTDLDALNAELAAPSVQAQRNGCLGPDKWGNTPPIREGLVLHPPFECRMSNGARIIAKYKNAAFSETATPRMVDAAEQQVLADAEKIAAEWVTAMRLDHVADKTGAKGIEDTGTIIRAMVEDVLQEAGPEIVDSKAARKAIGSAAAKLWKSKVTRIEGQKGDA